VGYISDRHHQRSIGINHTVVAGVIDKLGGPLVMLAQLQLGRQIEVEADLLAAQPTRCSGPVGARWPCSTS
jgi:Zn-dependent protease with chaperone function